MEEPSTNAELEPRRPWKASIVGVLVIGLILAGVYYIYDQQQVEVLVASKNITALERSKDVFADVETKRIPKGDLSSDYIKVEDKKQVAALIKSNAVISADIATIQKVEVGDVYGLTP